MFVPKRSDHNFDWKLFSSLCTLQRFSSFSHPGRRADARRALTLLNFGATTTVAASSSDLRTFHVVGQPTGPDDIADSEGHLASAYGAAECTLVLIRPDGYVALISDAGDTSAVSDYLAARG